MHLVPILTPFTFTFCYVSIAKFFFYRTWHANFLKLSLDRKCWHVLDPNGSFFRGIAEGKALKLEGFLTFWPDMHCTVLYISKGDLVEITFDPCNYILGWWGQGPDSRRSPNRRLARSPPPPRRPPPRSPRAPTPPPPRRSRRRRSCRWSLEPPWGRLGVRGVWLETLQNLLKLLFRRQEPGVFCVHALCQLWTVSFKKLFSANAFLWYFVKHRAISKFYLCLIQFDHKSCWALSHKKGSENNHASHSQMTLLKYA